MGFVQVEKKQRKTGIILTTTKVRLVIGANKFVLFFL